MVYVFVIEDVCLVIGFLILIDMTYDFRASRSIIRRFRNRTLKRGLPHIENLDLRPEAAKKPPPAVDLLTHIDELIQELMRNEKLTLFSPDKQTEWELRAMGQALYVAFRPRESSYFQRLNPGWQPMGIERPANLARIIIGQILLNDRDSGYRLEHLHCGKYVADANPLDPKCI